MAMLFDNSGSLDGSREFEKRAAIRFFRNVMRPIDQAAIYSVSTDIDLAQPMTSDVTRFSETIESFAKPEGATSLYDAIFMAPELSEAICRASRDRDCLRRDATLPAITITISTTRLQQFCPMNVRSTWCKQVFMTMRTCGTWPPNGAWRNSLHRPAARPIFRSVDDLTSRSRKSPPTSRNSMSSATTRRLTIATAISSNRLAGEDAGKCSRAIA